MGRKKRLTSKPKRGTPGSRDDGAGQGMRKRKHKPKSHPLEGGSGSLIKPSHKKIDAQRNGKEESDSGGGKKATELLEEPHGKGSSVIRPAEG